MESITLTRQELYELVWSESLLALSRKYEISDVGLRKMCKRLVIPLPDAGHWNKVQAGKKVAKKPLPIAKDLEKEITLAIRPVNNVAPLNVATLEKAIENDNAINITVNPILTNPDALIVAAQKFLAKRKKYFRYGELNNSDDDVLDIKVSEEHILRALCLLDTFIKAMRNRGYQFEFRYRESYVVLGKEKIKMKMREIQKRILDENSKYRSWISHPTGRLSLRFERHGLSAEIKDDKVPIEQQLSKLIAKLEILGERFRLEEIENEKRRISRDEENRLQEEYANRKKAELKAFKEVLEQAALWKKTLELREYISYVEQKAKLNNEFEEDLELWLEWVKKKADWLDPSIKSFDEWLVGVNPPTLFVNKEETLNAYKAFERSVSEEVLRKKSAWPLLPWYLNTKNSS